MHPQLRRLLADPQMCVIGVGHDDRLAGVGGEDD
jgi:hypothetical protein